MSLSCIKQNDDQELVLSWMKNEKTAIKMIIRHTSRFLASKCQCNQSLDFLEPKTFKDTVDGPDKVHWRKAICAELESMKLRGVFLSDQTTILTTRHWY